MSLDARCTEAAKHASKQEFLHTLCHTTCLAITNSSCAAMRSYRPVHANTHRKCFLHRAALPPCSQLECSSQSMHSRKPHTAVCPYVPCMCRLTSCTRSRQPADKATGAARRDCKSKARPKHASVIIDCSHAVRLSGSNSTAGAAKWHVAVAAATCQSVSNEADAVVQRML